MLPVAVDAMGGDQAPDVIVAGAQRAADELGVPVVLVGDPARFDARRPRGPARRPRSSRWATTPPSAVRQKKDASLNVAARAVRDGAPRPWSRPATPAPRWASALLRMGRIKGVARPAIATPLPRPTGGAPTLLLDAGANADCQAGVAGAVRPDGRGLRPPPLRRSSDPSVAAAVDRRGEVEGQRAGQGDPRPAAPTAGALAAGAASSATSRAATSSPTPPTSSCADGFTGNVALKTLEGALKQLVDGHLRGVRRHRGDQGGLRRAAPAPAAALRRARPQQHRRGAAPRRRRRLRHQPRLARTTRPSSTPSGWPPRPSRPTWSGKLRAAVGR